MKILSSTNSLALQPSSSALFQDYENDPDQNSENRTIILPEVVQIIVSFSELQETYRSFSLVSKTWHHAIHSSSEGKCIQKIYQLVHAWFLQEQKGLIQTAFFTQCASPLQGIDLLTKIQTKTISLAFSEREGNNDQQITLHTESLSRSSLETIQIQCRYHFSPKASIPMSNLIKALEKIRMASDSVTLSLRCITLFGFGIPYSLTEHVFTALKMSVNTLPEPINTASYHYLEEVEEVAKWPWQFFDRTSASLLSRISRQIVGRTLNTPVVHMIQKAVRSEEDTSSPWAIQCTQNRLPSTSRHAECVHIALQRIMSEFTSTPELDELHYGNRCTIL